MVLVLEIWRRQILLFIIIEQLCLRRWISWWIPMLEFGGGIEKTPSTRDFLAQHLLQLGCQAGHLLDRHC